MKTSVRSGALFCLIILVSSAASALDFSSYGFSGHPARSESGSRIEEFSSTARGKLTISYTEVPGQYETELINNTVSMFYSWGGLDLIELRLVVEKNRVDAFAVPRRYLTGGQDAAPYMPSGMHFIVTSHPEFDFRLKVGNLFVRMQGWFFNYDEFGAKVSSAIQNPYAYIRSNDPEYMVRKSEEFEKSLGDLSVKFEDFQKAITASVGDVNQDLVKTADAFRVSLDALTEQVRTERDELTARGQAAYDDLSAKGAAAYTEVTAGIADLRAETKASDERLESSFQENDAALKESFEKAAADTVALKNELEALRKEVSILRDAVITLDNHGLFGGGKAPDAAGVKRVIALKTEKPELTVKDIAAQLKAEGVKMTTKEITLVLAAYFGVY